LINKGLELCKLASEVRERGPTKESGVVRVPRAKQAVGVILAGQEKARSFW